MGHASESENSARLLDLIERVDAVVCSISNKRGDDAKHQPKEDADDDAANESWADLLRRADHQGRQRFLDGVRSHVQIVESLGEAQDALAVELDLTLQFGSASLLLGIQRQVPLFIVEVFL